jgi:hypothetical protein
MVTPKRFMISSCVSLRTRFAWRKHGMKARAKKQPASFVKMYVLLVPRETKVEHSQGVAALTDDQLEAAIAAVREMLDAQERQAAEPVTIEGKAEPVALPAPTQHARGMDKKA